MQIDHDALATIRAIRAHRDPLPVYGHNNETHFESTFPDVIIRQRLQTIPTCSTEHPRRVAPWADTVYHFQRTSLQHSIITRDPRLATAMVFAFEQFTNSQSLPTPRGFLSWDELTALTDDDSADVFRHTDDSATDFTEQTVMQTLTHVRHAITQKQHEYFRDSVYDTLPTPLTAGVPKAFWKQPDPLVTDSPFTSAQQATDAEQDTQDTVQSGLTDF